MENVSLSLAKARRAAVITAVNALNDTIAKALATGLAVDVDVTVLRSIRHGMPTITADVRIDPALLVEHKSE